MPKLVIRTTYTIVNDDNTKNRLTEIEQTHEWDRVQAVLSQLAVPAPAPGTAVALPPVPPPA